MYTQIASSLNSHLTLVMPCALVLPSCFFLLVFVEFFFLLLFYCPPHAVVVLHPLPPGYIPYSTNMNNSPLTQEKAWHT
jgi:hypothetical protein